jgi:hypothetical protein
LNNILGILGIVHLNLEKEKFHIKGDIYLKNPSLGLATKAKELARLRAKRKPRSHIACS